MGVELLAELNVWRRGDARAPHKPLLVLLALGRLSRGLYDVPYIECEPQLAKLIREFGPSGSSPHPEYPFWRLQNDGVWAVESDRPMRARASNSDPPRSELRSAGARGHLSQDILEQLRSNPCLIEQTAQRLLEAHFPQSLHDDIVNAIGLDTRSRELSVVSRPRRDPSFRNAVLQAYEYRCAVCSLDLRIGSMTVGLEAAHIKWHQAHGPDTVENGFALCSLHHKLFDFGALTVDEGARIQVSEQVHGTTRFDEVLMRHHGQLVRRPVRPEHVPAPVFVRWHGKWVFKREARPASPTLEP